MLEQSAEVIELVNQYEKNHRDKNCSQDNF